MKEVKCGSLDEVLSRVACDYLPLQGPLAAVRGQHDAKYELQTTLDRFSATQVSIRDYFRFVLKGSAELRAFSGRDWALPQKLPPMDSVPSFWKELRPYFELLIYLRHYGAPSPLLDWSASPYVAAHFAFSGPSASGFSAIYCYRDPEEAYFREEPKIHFLNPLVNNADKRHHIQ